MTETKRIEALLFDLGGVLIEIDFDRVFHGWTRYSPLSPEQIRARFAVDTAYHGHERGEVDAAAYFEHLRRLLVLDASDAEIAAGWNAIFVGRIEPALAHLRRAREILPCFCFTNTNPTHQAVWSRAYPELTSLFDGIFTSWEMGMRKPERPAFETVAHRIGVDPGGILFFDDLDSNIAGAKATGMQAVLVRDPDDIRRGLTGIAGPRTPAA